MSLSFDDFDTWLKFSLLKVEVGVPSVESGSKAPFRAQLLPFHPQHHLYLRMPKGHAEDIHADGITAAEAKERLKELIRDRDTYLMYRQKTITVKPYGASQPFIETGGPEL
jgi:hypothetical protein